MEYTNTKQSWRDKLIKRQEIEWTIKKMFESETNTGKVSVLAIPAGRGKSACIRKLITTKGNDGMIIVTDRIEQAEKYFTYCADGEEIQIDNHKAILITCDNKNETIKQAYYKPIIVMTMARYFQMEREEIKALIKWKHGKRTKVIIDEQPPMIELTQINMKMLNDIHSALYEGVDDTTDQHEKEWCLSQWETFRSKIESQMDALEKRYSSGNEQFYVWIDIENVDFLGQITDDDTRFFNFICDNERNLTKYGMKFKTDIVAAIKQVYRFCNVAVCFPAD